MTKQEVAGMIDHTLLAPNARYSQIEKLCNEAKENNFASVCVNPNFVSVCSEKLKDSSVKVCTVIGFPLGAIPSKDKAYETESAIKNGAQEVDMVIDISRALEGDFDYIESDISSVVKAARAIDAESGKKTIVKVILETCYLSDSQIVASCKASKNAGADFVKTSTGFATPKASDGTALPNGATEHHVRLMRETVGPKMGVKASGGIRSAETARLMIQSGANRIGTSSGIKIIEGWN